MYRVKSLNGSVAILIFFLLVGRWQHGELLFGSSSVLRTCIGSDVGDVAMCPVVICIRRVGNPWQFAVVYTWI